MKIKKLFVAIILASAVSIAHASPVQWTLDATQTSYSYKQAYGVFTYDADANLYSNVALRFTGDGNVYNINAGNAYGFNYGTSNGSGIYTFVFDTALTDAGGVVNGIATENDNDSTHPFTVRAAVLASPAATVPEPAQSALLFMGGMLMWIARRRGPPRRAAVH